MNHRTRSAVHIVREAVASATDRLALHSIGEDDDILAALHFEPNELESLTLILEEIFSIAVPGVLWRKALYRTPAALAEWLIAESDKAAWIEVRQQRRQA